MDPSHVIGYLGWFGWVVGIVSGTLQIQTWRKDRKLGPAKEQLFEEALRDREGQYSEEQIKELTGLVRQLERVTRTEIPRQARRVFLQSQLEAIKDNVSAETKQHRKIAEELRKLDQEAGSIPSEISEVIDSEILTPAAERHNYQRRLYLVVIALLIATSVPQVSDFLLSGGKSLLGNQPQPFGSANFIDYLAGCAVATALMFTVPIRRILPIIERHRIITAAVGGVAVLVSALLVVIVAGNMNSEIIAEIKGTSSSEVSHIEEIDNLLALASVVVLAVGIRSTAILARGRVRLGRWAR
jgi:hypothetical protein